MTIQKSGRSDGVLPVRETVTRVRRFVTASPEDRVRSFYEMFDRQLASGSDYRQVLGITLPYVNLGWWEPGVTEQDEASEALADRLAEAAGMGPGDEVLDVGFGYGEQDVHWLRTRGPARICGVNVVPVQVHAARRRAAEAGLVDRVDLRVASATALPFADNSFDRVVALESAMHVHTRERFFAEAFRVLRPGGVLAATDLLPDPTHHGARGILERLDDWRRRRVIPDANWYPVPVYADLLRAAGFVAVDVRDVSDRVLEPQAEFARRKAAEAAADERFRTARIRRGMALFAKVNEIRAAARVYVVAVARKPGSDR